MFRRVDDETPIQKTPITSMNSTTPSTRVQGFKEKNAARYAWLVEPLDKQGREKSRLLIICIIL